MYWSLTHGRDRQAKGHRDQPRGDDPEAMTQHVEERCGSPKTPRIDRWADPSTADEVGRRRRRLASSSCPSVCASSDPNGLTDGPLLFLHEPTQPQEMDNYVLVDPMSSKPIECWKKYVKQGKVCEPGKSLRLDTPIYENKVRFVCISDTHEKLSEVLPYIPDGDVLIHAGDFTNYGDVGEVIKFNAEIGKLPHKHKIVIAGNHELGFEDGEVMSERQLAGLNMLGIKKPYELLSSCTYLCDKAYEAYGIKIYGAPWHSMPGYAFYRPRGQKILHKWNQIPAKIDVLITHSPPLGHGDFNSWAKMDGILAGCAELLNTVEQRVQPKYHVFGHVHQKHGVTTNGTTTFINAALCDHKLRSAYDPIIFDLPLPVGQSKV